MGNPNLSVSGHKNIKIKKNGSFEVMVKSVYVGLYATIEEAIQKRDEFIANDKFIPERRTVRH